MKANILSRICAVALAMMVAMSAAAQAKIDKFVSQLEKRQGVTVTYTETRNPKTKKIVRQNIILNGDDSADARSLWAAFEAERENSVKVVKTGNKSFIIKFQDKKGYSSYVLSVEGSTWSLVLTKSLGDNHGQQDELSWEMSDGDLNDLALSVDMSLDDLEALNALGENIYLKVLKKLGSMNFGNNVKVYQDGRLIYEGSDFSNNTKSSKSKSPSKSTSRSKTTSKSASTTTRTITYVM